MEFDNDGESEASGGSEAEADRFSWGALPSSSPTRTRPVRHPPWNCDTTIDAAQGSFGQASQGSFGQASQGSFGRPPLGYTPPSSGTPCGTPGATPSVLGFPTTAGRDAKATPATPCWAFPPETSTMDVASVLDGGTSFMDDFVDPRCQNSDVLTNQTPSGSPMGRSPWQMEFGDGDEELSHAATSHYEAESFLEQMSPGMTEQTFQTEDSVMFPTSRGSFLEEADKVSKNFLLEEECDERAKMMKLLGYDLGGVCDEESDEEMFAPSFQRQVATETPSSFGRRPSQNSASPAPSFQRQVATETPSPFGRRPSQNSASPDGGARMEARIAAGSPASPAELQRRRISSIQMVPPLCSVVRSPSTIGVMMQNADEVGDRTPRNDHLLRLLGMDRSFEAAWNNHHEEEEDCCADRSDDDVLDNDDIDIEGQSYCEERRHEAEEAFFYGDEQEEKSQGSLTGDNDGYEESDVYDGADDGGEESEVSLSDVRESRETARPGEQWRQLHRQQQERNVEFREATAARASRLNGLQSWVRPPQGVSGVATPPCATCPFSRRSHTTEYSRRTHRSDASGAEADALAWSPFTMTLPPPNIIVARHNSPLVSTFSQSGMRRFADQARLPATEPRSVALETTVNVIDSAVRQDIDHSYSDRLFQETTELLAGKPSENPGSVDGLEVDAGVSPMEMFSDGGPREPCAHCGRCFHATKLARHEAVCRKVFCQKRKQFSAQKQRMGGTEAFLAYLASQRCKCISPRLARSSPCPSPRTAAGPTEQKLRIPFWQEPSPSPRTPRATSSAGQKRGWRAASERLRLDVREDRIFARAKADRFLVSLPAVPLPSEQPEAMSPTRTGRCVSDQHLSFSFSVSSERRVSRCSSVGSESPWLLERSGSQCSSPPTSSASSGPPLLHCREERSLSAASTTASDFSFSPSMASPLDTKPRSALPLLSLPKEEADGGESSGESSCCDTSRMHMF